MDFNLCGVLFSSFGVLFSSFGEMIWWQVEWIEHTLFQFCLTYFAYPELTLISSVDQLKQLVWIVILSSSLCNSHRLYVLEKIV